VIGLPATPTRGPVRQQLFQTSPLIIGQIMAIKHNADLSHSAVEIHGTRPSDQPHRPLPRLSGLHSCRPSMTLSFQSWSHQTGPGPVQGRRDKPRARAIPLVSADYGALSTAHGATAVGSRGRGAEVLCFGHEGGMW
jgi:hypothetical protein